MVRIPRRTHSVSGPPSAHSVFKDVACCCNIARIQQFYMAMMALRRNPQRKCKKEGTPLAIEHHVGMQASEVHVEEGKKEKEKSAQPGLAKVLQTTQRKYVAHPSGPPRWNNDGPFRFFELPREVRDHVYSYLVVRRGRCTPIIEAISIIKSQKKRATTQRTRERLNLKRAQSGRQAIAPREFKVAPLVHLNVLQASKALHFEASDYFYQNNWFAITLNSFPNTTIDTPDGWDLSRITKLQLEMQLKDAHRMNSHIDWMTFFSGFPVLRFLRIIPTFHPRYYDWAQTELDDWHSAHFIFKAFFRELLAAVPQMLNFSLGPSLSSKDHMQLEGKAPVDKKVLWDMYCELGTRKDEAGRYLTVNKVVDCTEMIDQGTGA